MKTHRSLACFGNITRGVTTANVCSPTSLKELDYPMVKRKGSIISKDEEQVFKRRLRSGRTIDTSVRLTKEVVTASVPSNPRVKPFTSTKSAMKIARAIDNEDGLDENYDELCSTSSHDSQAVVVHKKVFSNETNMNWISADLSPAEKKDFQSQILHGNTSISKAISIRKEKGIVITSYLLRSRN